MIERETERCLFNSIATNSKQKEEEEERLVIRYYVLYVCWERNREGEIRYETTCNSSQQ